MPQLAVQQALIAAYDTPDVPLVLVDRRADHGSNASIETWAVAATRQHGDAPNLASHQVLRFLLSVVQGGDARQDLALEVL